MAPGPQQRRQYTPGVSPPVAELGRRATAASRALHRASSGDREAALLAVGRPAPRAGPRDPRRPTPPTSAAAEAAGLERRPPRPAAAHRRPARGHGRRAAQVAALPDPVGEVLDGWERPNGLELRRVRVPLGVVAIIYENRPNVTSDAAGDLRQVRQRGAAARLVERAALEPRPSPAALRDGVAKAGLPADAVQLVEDPAHEAAVELMRLTDYVDCLIPRGGAVAHPEHPRARHRPGHHRRRRQLPRLRRRGRRPRPGARHRRQRQDATGPSVCNAAESLVVHEAVADAVPAPVCRRPRRARRRARSATTRARRAPLRASGPPPTTTSPASSSSLQMTVAIAPTSTPPSTHVNRFGTGHTEAIVTRDLDAARRFVRRGRRGRRDRERVDALHRRRASSASAPRSGSPPRSSTPAARWASGS